MIARVPRAAVTALQGLVDRHLREHGWSETQALEDTSLDSMNLADFLLAALRYAREQHPWIGRKGVVVEATGDYDGRTRDALLDALPADDQPMTVDACVEALATTVPFVIADEPAGRGDAEPQVHPYYPHDWPAALAAQSPLECVFGVIAEEGWIRDRARRDQVLRAVGPIYYDGLSFVELDDETASRLASSLLAGPRDRGSFKAHAAAARAFVHLFGARSRSFANRDFDEEALADPFAHGEPASWSYRDAHGDLCAGGTLLVLMVTDGARVARLDALWDTWSE
jgi:hypothetical protein